MGPVAGVNSGLPARFPVQG